MADIIVVLDGARVLEVGSHDELVAKAGHYAVIFLLSRAGCRGPFHPRERFTLMAASESQSQNTVL